MWPGLTHTSHPTTRRKLKIMAGGAMRLAHGNSQRVGLAERAEARKVMPSGEIAFAGDGPPPITRREAQRLTRPLGRPWCVLKSLPTPGGDNIGFMRSKWVDLMMHRGALACARDDV